MKKLLCMVGPFNPKQVGYVYEDGNKLDVINFTLDSANEQIKDMLQKYEIENVEFKGPHQFSKGIWDNFTKYSIKNYEKINEVKVTYL